LEDKDEDNIQSTKAERRFVMQRKLVDRIIILSAALLIAGYANAASSLRDYEPKSPDEEAIVSLILNYENAYNSGNIQGIKDLFWDEGKSMYGYQRMVFTKAEFDTVLPKKLADYPVLEALEPSSIEISGMNAKVYILVRYTDTTGSGPPEGTARYTIECIKHDNQWLFKSISF
jgi:hypothetical protein